jgi:hypothetical protein
VVDRDEVAEPPDEAFRLDRIGHAYFPAAWMVCQTRCGVAGMST